MTEATSSLWEIAGVVSNAVGLLAVALMLSFTIVRHRAGLTEPSGVTREALINAANRHYRCEVTRILYHLIMLARGLWAMLLPNPTTAFGEWFMISITLLSIFVALASILDVFADDVLVRLVERMDARP